MNTTTSGAMTQEPTETQYVPSALSLNLRIGSVFIMFVASLLGVVIPLYFFTEREGDSNKVSDSDNFRLMRSFAAGVMMGVAFIHLLSDGNNKLNEIPSIQNGYSSLAYTLAISGVLMVLGFEQVAVALISGIKTPEANDSQIEHDKMEHLHNCGSYNHDHGNNSHSSSQERRCPNVDLEMVVLDATTAGARTAGECGGGGAPVNVCEHHHAIGMIAGSHSMNVTVKAYMMEMSVAIHSVIIGVDLGSQSGIDNLPVLRALMIAISLHQFFEGLGLGATLQEAQVQLGKSKIIIFIITFAMTVSIGVVIGILVTLKNEGAPLTDDANYATGCLNSLAAGILIYVSLVEMAAEDFQAASIASNTTLKTKMMLALMLGAFFMAILAIWA